MSMSVMDPQEGCGMDRSVHHGEHGDEGNCSLIEKPR
jgi:hypothetical protein